MSISLIIALVDFVLAIPEIVLSTPGDFLRAMLPGLVRVRIAAMIPADFAWIFGIICFTLLNELSGYRGVHGCADRSEAAITCGEAGVPDDSNPNSMTRISLLKWID